jgi:hypothetical protein
MLGARLAGIGMEGAVAESDPGAGALRDMRGPLIATRPAGAWAPGSRRARAASLVLVVAATLLTYWPTVRNGFLQIAFDDAIVVDTAEIRGLDAPHLAAMATRFNHAHYAPLTMLSLALDYRIWGLDPFGYHLTNIGLHALTAALVCVFLWPIMPSLAAATLAALVFAVHPLQMESVSLVIQRKTVLSGALCFAALIAYQAWRRGGRRRHYAAAVITFVAAALAKPVVVTLPVLLWLYEYTFIGGRLRWRDKVPFVAIAAACAAAALAAHAAVDATPAWHGGDPLTHLVMSARVTAEYLSATFLPLALSPTYYYRRALAFEPLNLLALAALSVLGVGLVLRRHRFPWTFFCAAWFAIGLLPESNVVQLRADRFLYLPLLGAAIWFAVGLERLPALGVAPARAARLAARAAGAALVAVFALVTYGSAGVWRSDVTAWTRVAERHPWSATAFLLLGHAYLAADDPTGAEAAYLRAVDLKPDLAEAHLALARLYLARGEQSAADLHAERFVELAPESPDGPALLTAMRRGDS